MREKFNPLTRTTRLHIYANPFIKLAAPIILAYEAIGHLTAHITAEISIIGVIIFSLLHSLIKRIDDVSSILTICAIAQKSLIDRISIQSRMQACRQFLVRACKLLALNAGEARHVDRLMHTQRV